jgi:hypothetical protein
VASVRTRPDRSPLCNRVTPYGELIAVPERGLVYANRGCLHDPSGSIRRRYAVRRWIACRLEFHGRRRAGLMMPGRYTELFFLDDVTAMAAGHRACGECRYEDYERLRSIWSSLYPDDDRSADVIDARLHRERVVDGDSHSGSSPRQVQEPVLCGSLPDGAFVSIDDAPWLVRGSSLRLWTPGGYTERRRRPGPRTRVQPITTPSFVEVLRAGWDPVVPLYHPSAD